MIGRLYNVVLDSRDPAGLAEFYAALLGWQLERKEPRWITLVDGDGRPGLAFQYSPEHERPTFPDPTGSQQFHLDVAVDDVDVAERHVVAVPAGDHPSSPAGRSRTGIRRWDPPPRPVAVPVPVRSAP